MRSPRRSPYVTLGLPSDATVEQARAEYARRSEHLRRGRVGGTDAQLLAWALAEIERHAFEPATRLDTYRIPVDTASLRPPAGGGILRPRARTLTRSSAASSSSERDMIFDAARIDAARALLDRAAVAAGRQLDRIGSAPLPQLALPEPPARRRGLLPIAVIAATAILVLVVALLRPEAGDDDQIVVDTTAVATTQAPTTVAPTTTEVVAPPGIGDPQSVDGVTIVPDAPLNGFGVLCLLVRLDGTPPLEFDRSKLALISGGDPIAVAPEVGTGRASLDDVPAGSGEAVREACFPVADWQLRTTELLYVGVDDTLTWVINDPTAGP
jgi:hypothetical protein